MPPIATHCHRLPPTATDYYRVCCCWLTFSQVEHTRACWRVECVHEHHARTVDSLLSAKLVPRWRRDGPCRAGAPCWDVLQEAAAVEAHLLYERLADYSWNLVGYQHPGRGPLGRVLPEMPLPRAQAMACRAVQRTGRHEGAAGGAGGRTGRWNE